MPKMQRSLQAERFARYSECSRCNCVKTANKLRTDRHMARHKEKDAEAGGEGMGKLQTRKRLWRDSTGTVVAKRRPELEKKNVPSKQQKKGTPSNPEINGNALSSLSIQTDAPISPPGSLQDQEYNGPELVGTSKDAPILEPTEDLWPVSMDPAWSRQSDVNMESYNFLCNASWGSESQDDNGTDLLYNDLFAPDTGKFKPIVPSASSH